MKNIVFYIVFLIISTTHLQAQEFDMGDIMETAMDFVEEAQGGAETQADNQSMGQMVDKLLKKTDDPAFKALIENLSQALKEFENESYTGKCLQVMGAYAEALAYADRRVELAGNACEKKEWLGIEGLLLLTGGTINYCPTEFYGLSDQELNDKERTRIIMDYELKIRNYFFGGFENDKYEKMKNSLLELINLGTRKYLKDVGKKSYEELNTKEKSFFDTWLLSYLDDFFRETQKIENAHMKLYYTFVFANYQLRILNNIADIDVTSGKTSMVDFVGKMFTPEFMLSKTVEIAKLSNLYKCSN